MCILSGAMLTSMTASYEVHTKFWKKKPTKKTTTKQEQKQKSTGLTLLTQILYVLGDLTEEEMLEQAIALSMQQGDT